VSPSAERAVERALGYRFHDRGLLETALTHRSHSHEREPPRESYERLELLGDALLGFLVAEWLFRDDPTALEGVLSRRRQAIVRTTTLARVAAELGLGRVVHLGRGEERGGGRNNPSMLADLFEATLAAVYLDGGIRPARAFVLRHLGASLRATRRGAQGPDDYKTRLQEEIQGRLQRTPRYRIVATTGPAHALRFDVEVLLGGRVLGRGSGSSRKQAEQHAAREALAQLPSPEGR